MKSERSWSRLAGVTLRLHRAGSPFRHSDLELNVLSDALVTVRMSERTHMNSDYDVTKQHDLMVSLYPHTQSTSDQSTGLCHITIFLSFLEFKEPT